MLGWQACGAKSNEITAIPSLLERLSLTSALVTVDAIGCQNSIAQATLDGTGECLHAVEDNQPDLHDEVRRLFDKPSAAVHSRFEISDGDHRRA